ncbi:MAG: glycosyl transferase family 2, partial [Campylobacter sp.]|nr:glycosyl transferase family 2 [Campylobacter sp.]
DADIERRFKLLGIKFKSCRNHAIVVHLYHKSNFDENISNAMLKLMHSKGDNYFCKNGIKKDFS